jgi:hypothetical protein
MFSISKSKIQGFEKSDQNINFYNVVNDNEFPIRKYIETKYGYAPSFLYTDDEYTGDIFHFLLKNGKLLSYTSVGKLPLILNDKYKGLRGGTFWFYYKKVYIRISLKDQPDDSEEYSTSIIGIAPIKLDIESEQDKQYKDTDNKIFTLTFVAPSFIQEFPLDDFKDFILTKTIGRVHIFIKNQYGEYNFEPIKIDIPENMDLALNYGEKFPEISDTIINRLTEKPSGLYMFHGAPGTGKTTFIKYLAGKVERDFIYVPTNMLEYFTTDPNSLSILLHKPNSVLVLEDAEKAILKREGDSNSSVSSLLNLSDGIMSDIMKTAIILTYNCPKQDIDEALRRKGRLQMDYEFGLLSLEDAHKLAMSLKYPKQLIEKEIKEPMSIADIYNLQTKVEFYEKKEPKDRIIGFGK